MRILHFCMNAPFTEHYSYQDNLLTEYQHKLGHDVRIITTTKTRGADGRIIQTETGYKTLDNGVELVRLPLPGKVGRLLGKYRGLREQLLAYKPDFVFVHGLCSFVPDDAIWYKKTHNSSLHIVADNHQDEGTTRVDDFITSIIMQLHKKKWKRWIIDIDKVYGTTSWRVSFAKKYYGIPNQKIDTLIMGIDSDRIPSDGAKWRNIVREELKIPDDKFVFVTGGKLDKNKRIIESMEAFSKLKNDCMFLIFGSVSDNIKDKFYSIIDDDDRFDFIGYINSKDIWKYFYASDFGVFPGRHSVLWEEAIGCGLPCLFHRYEEKDHTEVCGNCICVKDSDVEIIYEKINKVISDDNYYQTIKRNAYKASSGFSYEFIAEKSLECANENRNEFGAIGKCNNSGL